MKFAKVLFRNTLGTRIVMLFMFCALVPMLAMAVLAFNYVTRQLNEQSRMRLHQEGKALGMSLIERLLFLSNDIKLIAASTRTGAAVAFKKNDQKYIQYLQEHFKGLAIVERSGRRTFLLGGFQITNGQLTPEQHEHLAAGRPVLSVRTSDTGPADIYITLLLDPQNPDAGSVWALLDSQYLWWGGVYDSPEDINDLWVLDDQARTLFCSQAQAPDVRSLRPADIARRSTELFEYQQGGRKHIGIAWPVLLQYEFSVPSWTVVLSTEKADILKPAAEFKTIFFQVLLVLFWVVLLLSLVQIRRNLVPLQKLMQATQDIIRQKFDTRVTIASGDEFEDLAKSFNAMAAQLGRQFDALTTMGAIDRGILSSLDTRTIIENMIAGSFSLFECACSGVTLRGQEPGATTITYCSTNRQGAIRMLEGAGLNPAELERLTCQAGAASTCQHADLPACLWPLIHDSVASFLVVPLVINEAVAGFVWLGFDRACPLDTNIKMHAEQIANQVAVALSKARLVQELEQLNQGTLMALARTVDMKSRWTAGHSERVTSIAVKIGRAMQLPQAELDDLHRGSLIHDIGKIGIASRILDKPGRLSNEERKLIQEHPHMGARILEPIKPYAGIIRLVAQHHELYDGSGYPDGLAGNQIILPARILAVADVCDALLSDRPYRPGSSLDVVIDYIQLQSGKQFDPAVVTAFLKIIDAVRMEYAASQTDQQEIMTLLQENPQGGL